MKIANNWKTLRSCNSVPLTSSWECNAAGIHHPTSLSIQTTYWTNRWDQPVTYWGGAEPTTPNCACGMTGTCSDPGKVCNCDMNDNVWRQDDGLITNLPDLPIHSIKAGDTGKNGQGKVRIMSCRIIKFCYFKYVKADRGIQLIGGVLVTKALFNISLRKDNGLPAYVY